MRARLVFAFPERGGTKLLIRVARRYYLDAYQDRHRISREEQVEEQAFLSGKQLSTVVYPKLPSVLLKRSAQLRCGRENDSLLFNPAIIGALGELAPRLTFAPCVGKHTHTTAPLARARRRRQ